MLRGSSNIPECTATAGAGARDDDSIDDNVSLECADSGLGLPSDHDVDRPLPGTVGRPAAADALSTVCYHPVVPTCTPAVDSQTVMC